MWYKNSSNPIVVMDVKCIYGDLLLLNIHFLGLQNYHVEKNKSSPSMEPLCLCNSWHIKGSDSQKGNKAYKEKIDNFLAWTKNELTSTNDPLPEGKTKQQKTLMIYAFMKIISVWLHLKKT